VVTVTDPKDTYPDETYVINRKDGGTTSSAIPNDGGQRRVGSSLGNFGAFAEWQESPADPVQWRRSREYYHQGQLIAYKAEPTGGYSYAAVDETAAYNNRYSRNSHRDKWDPTQANSSNRTYRVESAVRHFIFIPRGRAAYVVVYDQIIATESSFRKKWLLHSINKPAINGITYSVTRDELVRSLPFADLWPAKWRAQLRFKIDDSHYKYQGKLYGWMTLPLHGSITLVGGAGHQFDIAGTNYNECSKGQCTTRESGTYNEGLGRVPDAINPDPGAAPQQPGAWRIEESPSLPSKQDWFLNLLLVTSTTDHDVVSTAPATVDSGDKFVTTWKDNFDRCAYSLTLPKSGVGITLQAVGTGCIGLKSGRPPQSSSPGK